MNDAHLHLLSNHFPIIIPIIGLLVMIFGLFLRSDPVKRTAYGIFVLGALLTIPAFYTGEGAEEVVETIQGIDEAFIEEHEEKAETFAWLAYLLGGIALIGLWSNWTKKSFSPTISIITILYSLVVLYFAQQTGTTGGEIRHTEIRSEATMLSPNTTNTPLKNEGEHDDD